MNEKTILYIIQGFIASGKTTYSTKLAKQNNAVHLNPDKIVEEMFEKEEYMKNWDKCFNSALIKMWEVAKENLLAGKSVVLDMGFWNRADRDIARAMAQKCCADFKHIYLYAPDEILKKRIIETRSFEWANLHIENFHKNKLRFEEPQEDEEYTKINNF